MAKHRKPDSSYRIPAWLPFVALVTLFFAAMFIGSVLRS